MYVHIVSYTNAGNMMVTLGSTMTVVVSTTQAAQRALNVSPQTLQLEHHEVSMNANTQFGLAKLPVLRRLRKRHSHQKPLMTPKHFQIPWVAKLLPKLAAMPAVRKLRKGRGHIMQKTFQNLKFIVIAYLPTQ